MMKSIASRLYQNVTPVQWLWPVSPTPTIEQLFTFWNFLIVIILFGVLAGVMAIKASFARIDALATAKQKAQERRREDVYSKIIK